MNILLEATKEAIVTFGKLSALQIPLERAAEILRESLLGGSKLLVCGNGGSAADGADFSTEFACRFKQDRRPYPALNLSGGGSLLTAIGNDYDFSELFARQIRAFGRPGDLLVAITTSGNSKNILRALEESREMGLKSIALLGKGGGAAAGLATVELLVPSDTTARIQEAQKFLLHVLCEMLEPDLIKGPPKAG